MSDNIELPVIIPVSKVSQPIGDFYVGSIDARRLLKISYTEIRRFQDGTQEKIAGIQRERSPKRVEEIKRYVNLEYATFPTSIIIAVERECVEITPYCPDEAGLDSKFFNLKLSPYGTEGDDEYIPLEKIAFIIDGQHRLAGLEGLRQDRKFDVNVSIFVGASEADRAEIFARVNQAQTKVNQSLVIDLASFYEERGPVKFAHEIVLAMNASESGPFHDKVKRLGTADPGKGRVQTLAQASVVRPIVDYITPDPEGERNQRYMGLRSLFGQTKEKPDWRKYIFYPFYEKDDDGAVFACLTNYFNAVKDRWPNSWDNAPSGSILNRTTGYGALMRLLRPVYLARCREGEILKKDDCDEIFGRIKINETELTKDVFIPGSSGMSRLYKRMLEESGLGEAEYVQRALF